MAHDGYAGTMPAPHAGDLDYLIDRCGVKSVVEIGSFLGTSATFFAKHYVIDWVVCIDPGRVVQDWWAPQVLEAGLPLDYEPLFRRNVEMEGCSGKVSLLRGISAAVVDQAPVADMVYIDGDHTYEGCHSDIRLYLPKAGKVICGDDFHYDPEGNAYFPGVHQAVEELLPGFEFSPRIWWKFTEVAAG
jgi:predicted O-methyltransferase YrrM